MDRLKITSLTLDLKISVCLAEYSRQNHLNIKLVWEIAMVRVKAFNQSVYVVSNYYPHESMGVIASVLDTNEMKEVHDKIKNLQDPEDLKTSLTLAAEAGNALLAENRNLQRELYDMTEKESHTNLIQA
ncbi:hypothetical protein J6590_079106 [Homalodisca vitripennis]|nr:hypothetical protein J6590_079106 [Homalodisca vitripennis]